MIKHIFQGLSLTLALAACSQGSNRLSGQQCERGVDPVPMGIPSVHKVQLKAANLPIGEYKLHSSTLYFRGDATPESKEGFVVQVRDGIPKKSRGAELATVTDCFRNAKVTQEYAAEVQGISSMTVTNGRVETTAKTFGFRMTKDGHYEVLSAASLQKPSVPEELFNSATETFVVRHKDDIEVRTTGRGTHGTYFLSEYLRKVK